MTAPQESAQEEYLMIGQVTSSFGLRGQLKVLAVTNQIAHLQRKIRTLYVGPKHQPYQLGKLIEHKPGVLLITLEGITTRDTAETLRGAEIAIRATEAAPLSEGEYFIHALYGLLVVTDDGTELGRVHEVLETGANDVLVVKRTDGSEVLIPIIQSVVRELDVASGRIVIHLLEGLL
jgi:16S rRNA processing protein RimM